MKFLRMTSRESHKLVLVNPEQIQLVFRTKGSKKGDEYTRVTLCGGPMDYIEVLESPECIENMLAEGEEE